MAASHDEILATLDTIRQDKGLRLRACQVLGRDEDTLLRNRERLDQWRLSEILILAEEHPPLAGALKAAMSPSRPTVGTAQQVFQDALVELDRMGRLTSAISDTLRDGKIDPREARELLRPLREMSDFAMNQLIPELEALARQVP